MRYWTLLSKLFCYNLQNLFLSEWVNILIFWRTRVLIVRDKRYKYGMQEGKEELWSWVGNVRSSVNTHAHVCAYTPHTHTFPNSVFWKGLEATTQLQWAFLMPVAWLLNTIKRDPELLEKWWIPARTENRKGDQWKFLCQKVGKFSKTGEDVSTEHRASLKRLSVS